MIDLPLSKTENLTQPNAATEACAAQCYAAAVVGAGHAGVEAALALARTGFSTVLFTVDVNAVAFMACNPAIGGTAKGQLVREIDAIGGEMAIAADRALLQIKMLNRGKGPAVYSLRGQEDKYDYHNIMLDVIEREPKLTLVQAEVAEILTDDAEGRKHVTGVRTVDGKAYSARAVVVATGVYLKGRVIRGDKCESSGPAGFAPANALTASLVALGLSIRRFKTGTPARIARDSIDYDAMVVQEGEDIPAFSFLTDERLPVQAQHPCWLTYTNPETHRIIRENIARSPLFNGTIEGVGPRYCPSIEDKVMRFQKERHQVFIEPEGRDSEEMYVQGMSSSLPEDVQEAMYHSVAGLENARFIKYAYAIEYDCIDARALAPTYEYKEVDNLYFAGQVNGSSGYEEAAAQGLMAGINASLKLRGEPPFVLRRDQAYIGVLTDDLVTKGTNEPYRMMTARAEHRILLRQDNADLRLTAEAVRVGLVSSERLARTEKRRAAVNAVLAKADTLVDRTRAKDILLSRGAEVPQKALTLSVFARQGVVNAADVREVVQGLDAVTDDELTIAVTDLKYEGYLKKEEAAVREQIRLSERELPADLDYNALTGLRMEARQKLTKIRPLNLGQASRISGVSPADIAVLIIYLNRL